MAWINLFTRIGTDYVLQWKAPAGAWQNVQDVPLPGATTVTIDDGTIQVRNAAIGSIAASEVIAGIRFLPTILVDMDGLRATAVVLDIEDEVGVGYGASLDGEYELSTGFDFDAGFTSPTQYTMPVGLADLDTNPVDLFGGEGADWLGPSEDGDGSVSLTWALNYASPPFPPSATDRGSINADFTIEIDTDWEPPIEDCADITGFNCTPYPENDNKTLAEYRQRMLVRAGFAAVAANPPPGVIALFNTFLQDAQDFLYKKYPALETRWIFRWSLEQDVRYYGIRDNDGLEGDCTIFLDPYKNIEGAWLIDLNGQWLPMACGIPPAFYTTVNNPALPFRYEIRQCVEIFPAPPADGYFLAIKGHFGKQPFIADEDKPTIDGELVYLWALANALDYYGKPSAAGIATQAKDYLGQLVAGTHLSKRYVPGARPLAPAVMPVYAPWSGEY